MSQIEKKAKKWHYWLIPLSLFCILVILIIGVRLVQRKSLQQRVASDYLSLLAKFDKEFPGRGLQDYDGSVIDDYAKSYAVFLSAEINRAKATTPFKLSEQGRAAGEWLLANSDQNGNGVTGWELPVAWDAYGDGTINPAGTEYTITTGIVINSLLDWYENDPSAPKDKILQTVIAATQPFIDGTHQTLDGFIPYSFSHFDDAYVTYNSATYMLGQLQRISTFVDDTQLKLDLTNFADQAMQRVIADHLELSDGSWYWLYGDLAGGLNELAHATYIVDGIRNYILYSGNLADQIEWKAILKYLDTYSSFGGLSVYEYQPGDGTTLNDYPRLYDLGSYLRLVSLCKPNTPLLINLVDLSEKYQVTSGHYAKYIYPESDNALVINEYESFILYGWSIILSNQQGACFKR